MGSLREITGIIEQHDRLSSIYTNAHWKNNVSAEIQRHCNTTKSYKGAENIFYSVYGIGEGYWGLISMRGINESTDTNPIIQRQINAIIDSPNIDNTQKDMIIKARIGQGLFRDKLIEKYKHCLITGIDDPRLLIASHIKPWCSSNNYERLSVENGLLLSPLYDKLFDIGLITFDKKMRLVTSSELSEYNQRKIELDGICLNSIGISSEFKTNMEYHRDVIF